MRRAEELANGSSAVQRRVGDVERKFAAARWRRPGLPVGNALPLPKSTRQLSRWSRTSVYSWKGDTSVSSNPPDSVTEELLSLERAALVRWSSGDPSGFLEISAPAVTYFDPFQAKRIDGIDALQSYYESLRGSIHAPRFEILDPKVQLHGDTAIMSYQFTCVLQSGKELHWNCSEVFVRHADSWRIVHTHWSMTKA
jgi:ketosteroid isomerase-like protein